MLCNFVIDCNRLKHRGPDWSGLHQHGDFYLPNHRCHGEWRDLQSCRTEEELAKSQVSNRQ
ncbi:hypothetical protein OIU78_018773 [Salix suchowensis]|nr:hypothetical protein OIU78_018773 [Salix suchowensis]